ncbi:SH3 domain-containing protein [Thiohalorhabdus sp.]|uniref:SH3 domain-containing protein n=1 Tax=Thiohalorhabdus sp. TaxID=3094134 RepID=UPI002FC3C958
MNHRRSVLLIGAALLAFAPSIQAATFRAINGSQVNLRAGPGTDHKRLFLVSRDYPVRVMERRQGWAKVEDFEGDQGWVHGDLLADRRTLLVTKDLVNIRKGPSTDHEVAFQAQRNVLLTYLEEEAGWVHVRHADGAEGWVHGGLVWGD